jgi:23S rRNA pseudouridine1911/1915/1917 synthase
MAHIRHALLGDPVYGGRFKQAKGMTESCREALQGFRRQALHAGVLGFKHPTTGKDVRWETELPEDMQHILTILAEDASEADNS